MSRSVRDVRECKYKFEFEPGGLLILLAGLASRRYCPRTQPELDLNVEISSKTVARLAPDRSVRRTDSVDGRFCQLRCPVE